jgi:flagellar motor switch protein FliM
MSQQLSQEEIDRLFREAGVSGEATFEFTPSAAYDFRRADRIPKEQVRSIQLMHDFLARNLASSLSAYLRAYVTVTLVSVEQISFGEFLTYLPTPTCLAGLGMKPLDASAVLELNPSLVMPILNILLGGTAKGEPQPARELTEIEQSILQGILRLILRDLREIWAPTGDIEFGVEGIETQPQLMQILSPSEALMAIGFEIVLGEARGMMNFGVPSMVVKMLGHRFEQQWSPRRRRNSGSDRERVARVAAMAPVDAEVRVRGVGLKVRDLLKLEPGDILSLGAPASQPAEALLNGVPKFLGEVVAGPRRRGFALSRRLSVRPAGVEEQK